MSCCCCRQDGGARPRSSSGEAACEGCRGTLRAARAAMHSRQTPQQLVLLRHLLLLLQHSLRQMQQHRLRVGRCVGSRRSRCRSHNCSRCCCTCVCRRHEAWRQRAWCWGGRRRRQVDCPATAQATPRAGANACQCAPVAAACMLCASAKRLFSLAAYVRGAQPVPCMPWWSGNCLHETGKHLAVQMVTTRLQASALQARPLLPPLSGRQRGGS